jgi:hypothetical protein
VTEAEALADVVAAMAGYLDPAPDRYEVGLAIFAKRPWTGASEAIVLRDEVVGGAAESLPEWPYLMEVRIAVEVLTVWSAWRAGAVPTKAEAADAVIYYAIHDSYRPVE